MIYDKLKRLLRPAKESGFLTQEACRRLFDSTLRGMGCEVEWENEEGAMMANFQYQGGYFCARLRDSSPVVTFSFPCILTVDMAELDLVRYVCNETNVCSDGPRLVYKIDAEQNQVIVHILVDVILNKQNAKALLGNTFQGVFIARNTFVQWFENARAKQKNYGGATPEEGEARARRLQYLLREHELSFGYSPLEARESIGQRVTLADFVREAMQLQEVVPSRMDLSGDGLSLTIDASEDSGRRKDMDGYALSDALIDKGRLVRRFATLTLIFFMKDAPDERRCLTITLVAGAQSEECIYFQVTGVLTPLLSMPGHQGENFSGLPMASTVLMAYDLKDKKSLRDEVQFMWHDAMDKLRNGKVEQLTDEQRLIVEINAPTLAINLYRGRQLFLAKRYFEAMLMLRNAFDALIGKSDRLSAEEQGNFYEVCFMIGYCYDEMGLYRQGYYYLSLIDLAKQGNYIREMLNNLSKSDDPRAFQHISMWLDSIRQYVEEDTGQRVNDYEAAQHADYHDVACFLLSTRALLLFRLQRLDEAEKELTEMSKIADLADFSENVLRALREQREGQKDGGREASGTE